MIIDGRALAGEVLARTKMRAEVLARPPHIVAIVANESPATSSYLAIKMQRAAEAGCVLELLRLSGEVDTAALIAAVASTNADAVIVQLPLPERCDVRAVCDAIPLEKDADVLSAAARKKFENENADALLPPVVAALQEIFVQSGVVAKGKRAIVIGDGWLVGNPTALWLRQHSAVVEVVTRASEKYRSLTSILQTADIIVSGAGAPHLITSDMLADGVALIDAGTSESGGAIVGDADPSCADKCSLFTPVPGGIGPLAVAKLFENAVTLAERATHI